MAFKYRASSSQSFGKRKNKPIIFGKTIARVISSENAITDPRVEAAPMTVKMQKSTLNERSATAERPNKRVAAAERTRNTENREDHREYLPQFAEHDVGETARELVHRPAVRRVVGV